MIVTCYRGKQFILDEEDYSRIMDALKPGCKWYVGTGNYINGWCIINNVVVKIRLNRLVLNCFDTSKVVDHINGNKLDNRKENLRVCSHQQNLFNNSGYTYRPYGIKYKGVVRKRSKFAARIKYNYKNIHIGVFNTQEEAALAYNNKAKELFGEFACLNIIN